MSKLIWFGIGAASGVYLTRKASQRVRAYADRGIAEVTKDAATIAKGAAVVAKHAFVAGKETVSFVHDVRHAARDKEAELSTRLGVGDTAAALHDTLGKPRVIDVREAHQALPSGRLPRTQLHTPQHPEEITHDGDR